MFAFLRTVAQIAIPVFVISTMLNVGLTQRPTDILKYWRDWRFALRMLVANFVLAPLVMFALLQLATFDPALRAGLFLYSLCAGAPFLIRLTQIARHGLALGAAVMVMLVVGTVIYVPIVLPLTLSGISASSGGIATTLILQMLLPIAIGMLVVRAVPSIAGPVQPWVAKVGNYSLYVVIAATLIGYFPNLLTTLDTGTVPIGLVFIVASFGIGYIMGGRRDELQDVGGLATAQRNTAAALVVAAENFTNPEVLVSITLVATLGLVLLLIIARVLRRDSPVPAPTA